MVRAVLLICVLCASTLSAAAISARVDSEEVEALEPVKGTIRIVHSPDEEVDEGSFQIEERPLQAALASSPEEENGRIVSTYEFEVYPDQEGFNVLPSISALVGKERIESTPSTYSVEFTEPEEGLHLRALIRGKEPFYPGERLKFIYRIFYRGNVRLTKEELPLIEAENFRKIGGLEAEEFEYKGFLVREFTQEVQAEKPGEFSFGQSLLEGVLDERQVVRTEVEPFTITINPFPIEGRPPSFTGAFGSYNVTAELLTADEVRIGDEMRLKIEISGDGNMDDVQLPDIFCQPGFSGFFSPSGPPPAASIEEDKKTYTFEIVPRTHLIDEIPPIEFSSFDLEKREYRAAGSQPIDLAVLPRPIPTPPRPPVKEAPLVDWEEQLSDPLPVKPLPTPLEAIQKEPEPFNPWNYLWAVPIFALLWLFQYYGKGYFMDLWAKSGKKTARSYVLEASKHDLGSREFYRLIRLAFRDDGRGEVKNLLRHLDDIRFGKMQGSKEEVLSKARELT
jgi:hypothetical protein